MTVNKRVVCPGSGRQMNPPRLAHTVECPSCGLYQRVRKDGALVQHRVPKAA